jgi:hypothetical protein
MPVSINLHQPPTSKDFFLFQVDSRPPTKREKKQKSKASQDLHTAPQENKKDFKKLNCKEEEKHKKPKVTQELKPSQITPTV